MTGQARHLDRLKKGIPMYDPLEDIHQYGKKLTISQVVKFFEKKELPITRAMIQNYIRLGLLPPPTDKRFYTHKHLAALVLINYLKAVFEMADIKAALSPMMDAEGLPLAEYALIIQQLAVLSEAWNRDMSPRFFEEGKTEALSRLLIMTHAVDLRAWVLALQ